MSDLTSWPKKDGRFVCTKDRPMPRTAPKGPWLHEAAGEIGEQMDGWPAGDTVMMECPHCGITWTKELPQ